LIRVLIADDHEIVRAGLRQILAEDSELAVHGEANDGQELLELCRREGGDVVLLDLNMPGRNGLEILKQLRQEFPSLPVLILSIHPEDQYALRAIRAGASGYLTKETASSQLLKAIHKVYDGGRYISDALAERMAENLAGGGYQKPHEALSDREYQVMILIASGKSVGRIASELFLSAKTISTYRHRILEKMGMENNSELTSYVVRNGLLDRSF
jgi:DNA-binding NarL/FixJ family response regulator